ncbi:MAG: UvrD-helicase domain-containing protein, partial [Patescibacteria group bacterium]
MSLDTVELNAQQKRAVTYGDGPVLLVAGAGTGKTSVVTHRIAWLIAEGKARPEELLAVTFTEKAAAEMEERVDRLLPLGYTEMWIHTFHAFCQRILQDHAIDIGLPNDFTVLDTTGSWLLVRENLERFKLDYYKPLANPTKFIHALLQHFSRAKDECVYPDEYLRYAETLKLDTDQAGDREARGSEAARVGEIAEAYHVYQQLLLSQNAFDFGDLINYALKLFRERPKILEQYRTRFKHVLVDEFQDTNWAQYELVKLLAAPRNNLMVVGDDDQSIYKFRGASFSNIVLFKKDYQDAAAIYLVDNYRSGQAILDRAYRFIQLNNPDRLEVRLKVEGQKQSLDKKLVSRTGGSGEVACLRFKTADDEARGVISEILKLRESVSDFSWSDVAVLVRANDQAQRFVRYFRSMNMPHQYLAAKGLYSQDTIIAIIAYLKLMDNYHESEALYKILTLPTWDIDHETIVNLSHLASKKSWSLWHAIRHYEGNVEVSQRSRDAIAKLTRGVEEHTALAKKLDPSVLIYRFLEDSGYLEYMTREDTQYTREQMLYLNQFYKKVRTWEEEHLGQGVSEFVKYLNLELESGDAGSLEHDIEEGPENITVSTIHGAKGLEYRFVFVIGLVHLRFPSRERKDPIELPQALIKDILPEGDAHMQEERRLMYVALTRAKEKAVLTFAEDYGTSTLRKPSRFIEELGFDPRTPFSAVSSELVPAQGQRLADQKTTYVLPRKFSFTQLKAFETCPKQYYYAHIIRIPSAGRATFSFGKIMHAVLEKFFRLVMERSSLQQASLFGAKPQKRSAPATPVSLKALLALYEETWEEDWFFDEENKRLYREKGKTILKNFYESLKKTVPVPVALEQPFTMKIGGASFKGVIDRIDEEKGMWKLVDYKTGTPPKDGKLAFDDKEQLFIYQMAAEQVFGKKVGSLVLHFLENNTQLAFIASEKDVRKVEESVTEIISAIRSSKFEPTPGFQCKSCDYRFIC